MPVLWLAVCLAASPAASGAAAPSSERISIAVLPTKLLDSGRGMVDSALVDEAVLAGLQGAGDFRVFGHSDMNALLDRERYKDVFSCDETACFSEIGGALGAAALVDVKVGRADQAWVVTAKLINTGLGEPRVDARALQSVNGGPTELLAHLPRIMYGLLEQAGLPVRGEAPAVAVGPRRALISIESTGGDASGPKANPRFVEGELMRAFARHGIEFASKGSVGAAASEEDLLRLAREKNAALLVTGTAWAADSGAIMGTAMHALRAGIALRALDVSSGTVLATATDDGAAGHIDIQAGCDRALEKVAGRVAEQLAQGLAEAH